MFIFAFKMFEILTLFIILFITLIFFIILVMMEAANTVLPSCFPWNHFHQDTLTETQKLGQIDNVCGTSQGWNPNLHR